MALLPTLGRPPLRALPLTGAQGRPRACAKPSHLQCGRRQRRLVAQASAQPQEAPAASASTAKQAVELGLEAFAAGNTEAALQLFLRAQQLKPDDDEARAACYNAACAQARLRQWQAAVDSITTAVNQHDLKLSVALNDPDLEGLRERREWLAGLSQMRGGINDQQYVQLRSEAKAPFRLTRLIFVGGLAVGAALGLFIIAGRLVAALNGGEGAPDLQETLQNLGINSAALTVLGFIVYRDVAAQNRDKAVVLREEALGRLQIALGGGERVLPLAAFRGTTRPVIIAGSRTQVGRALAGAEPFQTELRARGVSLIPLVSSATDEAGDKLRQLKAEFGSGAAGAPPSKGFAPAAADKYAAAPTAAPAVGLTSKDRKWQLKAANEAEWQAWLAEQKAAAGTTADTVYVQIQLDGTVRASGAGIPPWAKFLDDLPELDSVRTKFTDGVGT